MFQLYISIMQDKCRRYNYGYFDSIDEASAFVEKQRSEVDMMGYDIVLCYTREVVKFGS